MKQLVELGMADQYYFGTLLNLRRMYNTNGFEFAEAYFANNNRLIARYDFEPDRVSDTVSEWDTRCDPTIDGLRNKIQRVARLRARLYERRKVREGAIPIYKTESAVWRKHKAIRKLFAKEIAALIRRCKDTYTNKNKVSMDMLARQLVELRDNAPVPGMLYELDQEQCERNEYMSIILRACPKYIYQYTNNDYRDFAKFMLRRGETIHPLLSFACEITNILDEKTNKNVVHIAFYESLAAFSKKRITTMRLGKYIAKYFPSISNEDIKRIVLRYYKVPMKLGFLRNSDPAFLYEQLRVEWIRLYRDILVDYSCMRGCSAVDAYADKLGPEHGLAYGVFESIDSKTTLAGRAIITWDAEGKPEYYVRVYPFSGDKYAVTTPMLEAELQRQGFKKNLNALEGHNMHPRQGCGVVYMPYLDGEMAFNVIEYYDDGIYVKVSYRGRYSASNSEGKVSIREEEDESEDLTISI